ncbi:MAG: hypothetical protein QXS02_01510 [Candidatus Thermoplasmatota archaeon]
MSRVNLLDEGKPLVLILSIVGVILLYILTIYTHPPLIQIKDIPLHEGKTITIQGTVIKHQTLKYSSSLITILDTDNTMNTTTIYSDKPLNVEYGDHIKATGIVQKYRENYEIVINKPEDVEIISREEDITIPIQQLSIYPQRYKDLTIKTKGVISSLSSDYLYLLSEDNKYTLIILYNPLLSYNISQGDLITAKGVFSYDAKNLRYILRVFDDTQPTNIYKIN